MSAAKKDLAKGLETPVPFVSVVIPTYNRAAVLADTVRYLLHQDYPSYEIIVVDQSPDAGGKRPPVFGDPRVAYYAIRGRGPQVSKNFGIGRAKGEIILTVDDDIIPEADLIARHVANYADPKVGAVGGRVFSPGQAETDHETVGTFRRTGIAIGNYTSSRRMTISTVFGCNFSFRRRVFDAVGPYDTRYIGNFVREESDLCARIIKAGYTIVFAPDARVVHLQAPSGGCRVEDDLFWQFYFLHNSTLFFLSHLKRLNLPFFLFEHLKRALVFTYHHGKQPVMLSFLLGGICLGYRTCRTGAVDTALLGRYLARGERLR